MKTASKLVSAAFVDLVRWAFVRPDPIPIARPTSS